MSQPRFRWMCRFNDQNGATGAHLSHLVLDLEPPEGEPGQVAVFGVFPNKQAAVMACMALNGGEQASPEVATR